jgi:GGDEF domain-containing protein
MISLRKLWTAESPPGDTGMRRVVGLLMQGIALHAVEGDPLEHQKFRQDMHMLLEEIEANPSIDNLLVHTGSALKALEDYNHRTTRHLRMQGAELQHMIAMLTRTVAALGSGSEKAVGRLQEIEGKLEGASVIEDVRALKLRMGECLEGIRAEAARHKIESAHTTATLAEEIQSTQRRIHAAGVRPVLDPSTGLPARSAAIAAMEDAAHASKPAYVALFIVDRVAPINARLGYAAGDQVLNFYLEELRHKLPPSDRLFRWSGPAFLALFDRPEPMEKVREQLRFAVPGKLERTVKLSNRSALVSVSATWTVFSIAVPLEGVIERLDGFLSSQSPHSLA